MSGEGGPAGTVRAVDAVRAARRMADVSVALFMVAGFLAGCGGSLGVIGAFLGLIDGVLWGMWAFIVSIAVGFVAHVLLVESVIRSIREHQRAIDLLASAPTTGLAGMRGQAMTPANNNERR